MKVFDDKIREREISKEGLYRVDVTEKEGAEGLNWEARKDLDKKET